MKISYNKKPVIASAVALATALTMAPSVRAATADAKEREEKVKTAVAELQQHGFKEITENPELRRKWWDMVWTAWSQTPDQYKPDFSDFDKSRYFEAPPAPYVHPRAILRPEQLPDLRKRLADTRSGQVFYKRYKDECQKLYADTPAGKLYAGLVEGKSGPEFDKLFEENIYETSLLMMWESLRILIDEDQAAGEKMAKATKNYAERLQKLYNAKGIGETAYFYKEIRELPDYIKEKTLGDKQYQEITGMFQEYNITLIYDFLYPYMDEDQRKVVRKLISDLSSDVWIHGMGIPDTGGNWGPHHWKGGLAAVTIEGEEGYDPDTVKGLRQVMTSFYSSDFTESGAIWEGLGKGSFGTEGLMKSALRGWDIAATQPVRRSLSRFMMHSMLPNRVNMMSLGGLGSSFDTVQAKNYNVFTLKYLYPNDPFIDYLYRLNVGEDYANLANFKFNRHYFGIRIPLRMLIAIKDYDGSKTLDEALEAAVAEEGLTFFCPVFPMMITRQDWSKDAAWLFFEARAYNYGHVRDDRAHFSYAALGRQWSIYPYGRGNNQHAHSYDAHNCSVMTIDNIGTVGQPAKMVDFQDSELVTYATADLKHSWDWREQSHNSPADRVGDVTLASMSPLNKDAPAWHHVPFTLYPHWRQPGGPMGPDYRVPHLPVDYAFRTVGMVRGKQTYALVLDDLKVKPAEEGTRKDRLYTWNMALPADVSLESVKGGDITLVENRTDGAEPLRLLVRVLQTSGDKSGGVMITRARVEQYEGGVSWSQGSKRLVVSSKAPAVRMRVMLFAYRPGTPLPTTEWDGDAVKVTWPDQKDRLTFEVGEDQRTKLEVKRL